WLQDMRTWLNSARHAAAGMARLWREERNARIESALAVLAILLGVALDISPGEWVAILLSIGIVLCAEGMNAAIEGLANLYTTQRDDRIKAIKDLAAGAVLLAACAALATGLLIFLPRIMSLG